jgi:hypothetical protein
MSCILYVYVRNVTREVRRERLAAAGTVLRPLPPLEGLPATRRAGRDRLAVKLSEAFGGAATSIPNRARQRP